jgi:DNA-binding CsgD family transcriptional regulator/signal transduction histidine kinase
MAEAENSEFETSEIRRFATIEDAAAAVEAERRRLAGLLQGSIIEPLNLLLEQAHIYEQTLGAIPQARMAVSVLASLARQVLQQVRDLEANLHPAILETLGLEAALETLVSQEMRAHNIHIRLVTQRIPNRLPLPIELALFRATQDALSRAILQSHASQFTVRLEFRENWLIFSLVDNGLPVGDSTILQASCQRVEALGGTSKIEHSNQSGLELYIYFPVNTAAGLTPREMEVIRHLAQGLSNKQIALALGVTARTINFHLDNIYSKLGVNTRTEAVIYAVRQGWITD